MATPADPGLRQAVRLVRTKGAQDGLRVAVVIPCYRVTAHVESVISKIGHNDQLTRNGPFRVMVRRPSRMTKARGVLCAAAADTGAMVCVALGATA